MDVDPAYSITSSSGSSTSSSSSTSPERGGQSTAPLKRHAQEDVPQRAGLIAAVRQMKDAGGSFDKPAPERRPIHNPQRGSQKNKGGGDVEDAHDMEGPMDCLKDLVSVAKAQVMKYSFSIKLQQEVEM